MIRSVAVAAALATGATACNSRTSANEAPSAALAAEACRADPTCVAIGGPDLEPSPAAVAAGRRCEPRCAARETAPDCDWAPPPAPRGVDPSRIASDGRVCAGPPRCRVERAARNAYDRGPGDFCVDPDPPCAGCREVFHACRSANLCSGVICP